MGKKQTDLDKLYSAVSAQFDIGDFDTFKSRMQTTEDRRKFYDAVSENGFDLGDYNQYEARLGKPTEVLGQGSTDTSQGLVEPTGVTEALGLEQGQSQQQPSGGLSEQSLVNNATDIGKQFVGGMQTFGTAVDPNNIRYEEDFRNDQAGFQRLLVDIPSSNDPITGVERTAEFEIPKGTQVISPRLTQDGETYSLQYIDAEGNRVNALETVTVQPSELQLKKRQLEQIPFDQWTEDDKLQYFASNIEKNVGLTEEQVVNERIKRNAEINRNTGVIGDAVDIVGGAFRAFGSGATRLGADALGIPEFLYDAISNVAGTPTFKEKYGETFLNDVQDYMRGAISRDDLYNSVRFNNKGVIESFSDGNISDGIAKLVMGTANSLPIMLSLSSGNAGALTSTLSMGAGQYNQLQENNPDMDLGAQMLNSTLTMYAEMIPEKIGAEATFKPFYDLFKKSGREVAESSLNKFLNTLAGQFGVITPTVIEGSTEASTAIMQNLIAKYSGEDPNRQIMDGVADAALMGGVSGGIISSPAQVSNAISNKKNRKQAETILSENRDIRETLNGQNIPDEVRSALTSKYFENVQKVNDYIESELDAKGRLSKKQQDIVSELERQRDRLNTVVNDPNVPDTLKESIQSDIDNVDAQIEEVLSQSENVNTDESQQPNLESSQVADESSEVVSVGEQTTPTQEVVDINVVRNDNARSSEILDVKENLNKFIDTPITELDSMTIEEGQLAYDEATEAIQQVQDSNISRGYKKELIDNLRKVQQEIVENETKFKTESTTRQFVETRTVEGIRRVEQTPEQQTERKTPKRIADVVDQQVYYNGELGRIRIGEDNAILFESSDGSTIELPIESKNKQIGLERAGITPYIAPKLSESGEVTTADGRVIGSNPVINKDNDGRVVSYTVTTQDGQQRTIRGEEEALDLAIELQRQQLGNIDNIPTERFNETFTEIVERVISTPGRINTSQSNEVSQRVPQTDETATGQQSQEPVNLGRGETTDTVNQSTQSISQEQEIANEQTTQSENTVQENEPTEVRQEPVQESTATEDVETARLRDSYNRLTEGMTEEQINADPDLVRMRERIETPAPVQEQTETTEQTSDNRTSTERQPNTQQTETKPREVSAKNSKTDELREKYGFGKRLIPETRKNDTVVKEARKQIKEEKVFAPDLVSKGLAHKQLTDVEQAVLAEYIGQLEDAVAKDNDLIESNPNMSDEQFNEVDSRREDNLNKLSLAIGALGNTGTEIARALAYRRNVVNRDMSLPSMLSQKRKAQGRALTKSEQADVLKQYNDIKRSQEKLEKRVEQMTEELSRAKADIALMQEQKQAELEYRKNKDKAKSKTEAIKDIQARREEAKKALKDSIKAMFNQGFAFDPKKQAKQDADFTKALGKLLRTYLDEALLKTGVKVNYNSVINNMLRDLQEMHPALTKPQLLQLLDNLNNDTRPYLDEVKQEIAELRAKVRDANLEAEKKSLQKRIDNLIEKIKNKDYQQAPAMMAKYDAEYRKLKKQLDNKTYDFRLEVERDKINRRTRMAKVAYGAVEAFGLPRALMATGDMSAPLRQGIVAMLGNPKTGIEAFKEMHRFAFNAEYYEAYMEDVADSEMYDLAMKSGLSVTGVGPNVWTTLREEQFTSKLISKVPVLGTLNEISERAFAGFLNKMRIDLFNYQANLLMNDGKNPQDNLDEFKAIATYVNAVTGRGPVPTKWEGFFSDLSTALFAPRLITSRLYLLFGGPLWSSSARKNPNLIKQYVKDMSAFVSFGIVTSFLASLLPGVELLGDDEDEPLLGEGALNTWTSTDFMNIKVGNTRYDIWGGFAQYVRLIAQVAAGQKTSQYGEVRMAEDGIYGKLGYIARFGRSKLSPSAAMLVDYTLGEDYMGEDFSFVDGFKNMLAPLVYQETFESMFGTGFTDVMYDGYKSLTDKEHKFNSSGDFNFKPTALATTLIPSFYGLGVQTWETNSVLKGIDNELMDVLAKKSVNTSTKKRSEIKVIDPTTGEDRAVTDEEYDKYKKYWDNYVVTEMKTREKELRSASKDKAKSITRSIKRTATNLAKKETTGVATEDLTVEFGNTTYVLSPEQLQKRIDEMEKWKAKNANRYNRDRKMYIKEGYTEEQADLEVQKLIDKDARAVTKDDIVYKFYKGRIKLEPK